MRPQFCLVLLSLLQLHLLFVLQKEFLVVFLFLEVALLPRLQVIDQLQQTELF